MQGCDQEGQKQKTKSNERKIDESVSWFDPQDAPKARVSAHPQNGQHAHTVSDSQSAVF